MEIIRAGHMGFCGGVERAVLMAHEALDSSSSEVWSVGPIIHNASVMSELIAAGLRVADSLDEVPDGAAVVVRSHGEGASFFEQAKAKNMQIIDATCPKVERIHELVRTSAEAGKRVVIVGDAAHPEVRGIVDWAGSRGEVVATVAEARALAAAAGDQALFVVSQTTFDQEEFERIAAVFEDAEIENTICDATRRRQEACRQLAEEVDLVIVVGDRHSSNTKKLFEIAKKHGKKQAIFVENKFEISLKQLREYDKVGLTAGASTPAQIVEEVISSMSEFRSENYETNPMHEYMDEIDKSIRLPRTGDIVTGEVIQVTDNDVTISLGCKKDGVIPKSEIALEEGQTMQDVFKEGEEVQAKVLKNDDGEGNILLSKKRVVVSEHWDTIIQACEDRTPIEVKIQREVNGGVIATFNEVGGFIPMSQLSDHYVEKADEFIGQTLLAKVIRVDQKRNKVVLSHKAVLNEERQKRMREIWDQLSVGDIIDGKVMRFTEYGAFVDIGGVDGLLHISEISWGKLRHPADLLEIGQEIKVKILSMNKEKEKISLGYKQNQPEPWTIINNKYEVGQVISGRAVQIKDYGVFVEIEPGLDGLVHISEIAFRRVTDISDELEVGQIVSAKILEIDQSRKRISLSIKDALDPAAAQEAQEAAAADAETAAEAAEAAEAETPEAAETPETPEAETAETAAETAEAVEAAEETAEAETPEAPEAETQAKAGDPSTEIFDENKDQEHEIPDPDGIDAIPDAEETAQIGDPSTEAFDENKDQEQEIPDPDGVDAVTPEEGIAFPGDPSTEETDENKDQEQEIPDPDGVDAVEE
ncbi:MAG: bifunctional 4-hydroxy-3-methylbut-2-enyl diphosphate reductase/30S ribosomal protein S1 [Clostridiales Family XIII bacterium]|jgi:4-hydroxy-3-methylbut-2-enyl diphosphate reductase|nr:bifunctional 4-hydroxy-3-methylbut-2-enyl diphosphate reductase/30S ribosomal protein S1 [Clostridiales Family XIII bacterium]